MRKRYIVDLTEAERAELQSMIRKGIAPARRLTRARVLLLADEGKTDDQIAAALHVHETTVARIRQRSAAPWRAAEARPQAGGVPDRTRLQRPARRPGALDDAAVGRPLGGAGDRR